MTFELRFYDAEGLHARINLLSLTRALEISLVWLEHYPEYYTLHWQEPFPLRNRRIFLRPIWQPWNNGFEIKIPDEAHNELILKDMGLPPSHYEVFFYIAPSWQPEYTTPPDVRPHRFLTIDPSEQLKLLSKSISQYPERAFQAHFERACIYTDIGKIGDRNNEITQCLKNHEQARLRILLTFYNWVGKINEDEQKSIWLKLFAPERLNELCSSMGSDQLSEMILQNAQNCMLPPQSALALLRLITDPQLILFCLRLLLEQHDSQGVHQIVEMVKNGHLSNSDAIYLLSVEIEFCLPVLGENLHDSSHKCLFSDLIDHYNEKDAVISKLPVDSLLALIASEQNTKTLRSYLELLIRRGESSGVDQIMDFFQQGRLRGDEVTDLLGVNPEFSYKILSQSKLTQAHNTQLLELKRKYLGDSDEDTVYPSTISQKNSSNSLARLIKLIHIKDRDAIYQVLKLASQGQINKNQLYEALETNPEFAYHTLLENHKVQQYQEHIITLSRKFPLETGHFTPGMFVHTPAGWGRIEQIRNYHDEVFDIAHKDEPDLILKLTLHLDIDPEKAVLDLGNNHLIFEEVQEIYECGVCKEFLTSRQSSMKKHQKNNHGGGNSFSRLPVFPMLKPFEIRYSQTDKQKTSTSGTRQREAESLFIASLSNNQLIRLALNHDASMNTVFACIATLIKRGVDDGMKYSFSFWRQQKINDNNILKLWGLNPHMAYNYLNELPSSEKPIQFLYSLADKYPVETFHIKPGMFIKTPAGWGKITHIQDSLGKTLNITSVESPNLKIKLTLHPNINPETAIADLNQGKIIFPTNQTYRCDLCRSCISANVQYISETHTKIEHPGKKSALSKQPSSIPFQRILEFSTELK